MRNLIDRAVTAGKSLSQYRVTIGVFTLSMLACSTDRATAPDLQVRTENVGTPTSASATDPATCPACAFGPRSYTRTTGQPVTDVGTFAGNPAGAYFIEIDDHGSQGANATVVLNGTAFNARSGFTRQAVSLLENNQLLTRLTGKPGSTLEVKIFQEVHSVTVTPNLGLTRLPATQQFTAVAGDANGVAIPNQTFEWRSSHATIATIGVNSGLATATGGVNDITVWKYNTTSTGEGTAQITARATGTQVEGSVPWRISAGFVYTTFRASLPLNSPNRSTRPNPEPHRYDVVRLNTMASRCSVESHNEMWFEYALGGERRFVQCFPALSLVTRRRFTILGHEVVDEVPNIGVYGRYCGGGHPDGDWYHHFANSGNYQPKDAIDAICMEHDAQFQNHELTDNVAEGALAICIVRYGIESETLVEDGVRVQPGSARWNEFWSHWPAMAETRAHFLGVSRATCMDDTTLPSGATLPGLYTVFLVARGLTRP